jgi:uroporphyrinogen-III synthase
MAQHYTVLVTRSTGQSGIFSNLLRRIGARIIEMPALEINPPSTWQPLDKAIEGLSDYDWLILTSANAVNSFMNRLAKVGNPDYLEALKLAVVGRKTASVLREYGFRADFVPSDFIADSLVATFPESVTGLKLLFPRVESGGRDVLMKEMTAAGAVVTEVAAYESGCPQRPDVEAIAALQAGHIDVITFASSKTVRYACQLFEQGLGQDWQHYIRPIAIASIGPKTSATCYKLLGRVDIEAAEYTLEGLTDAIEQWANASLD